VNSTKWYILVIFPVVLLIIALVLIVADVSLPGFPVLSAGSYAFGYLAGGNFSGGVFAAGFFSAGVFAAGVFAVGVFSYRYFFSRHIFDWHFQYRNLCCRNIRYWEIRRQTCIVQGRKQSQIDCLWQRFDMVSKKSARSWRVFAEIPWLEHLSPTYFNT
jgi:hypothetical protein